MALKFKITGLEDVEESLRSHYEQVDGDYQLKVDGMTPSKTDEDVQKLTRSLEAARNDAKTAKEQLRLEKDRLSALGDMEEIQEKLDELENLRASGAKGGNEEILKLKKELREKNKEFEKFKLEAEPQLKEFGNLKEKALRAEIKSEVDRFTAGLKHVDQKRLDMFLAREIEFGRIVRDELGELTAMGKPLEEYVNETVDLYGFTLQSNPGNIPAGAGDSKIPKADEYKKAAQAGDVLAMIANAPVEPMGQ